MSEFENYSGRNTDEFMGTALGLFGRFLITIILSVFIIPAPWISAWFYRWCADNVRLRDQTAFSFEGQGEQIWFPMMLLMAISLGGQFVWLAPLLLIPLTCYLNILIARWFWRNLKTGDEGRFSFIGEYLPFLGWTILIQVSILTIIGWAWATAGMLRWFCRNIESESWILEFYGNGWNILWRTVAFALSAFLIIPIPWTLRWLLTWYFENVSFTKKTELGGIANGGD